jgi:hypothetical protein
MSGLRVYQALGIADDLDVAHARKRSWMNLSRGGGADCLERLWTRDKLGAVFRGQGPKCFVINDVQAQVPRFNTTPVQDFAVLGRLTLQR